VVACIRIRAFFQQSHPLHRAHFAGLHQLTVLLTGSFTERTADVQTSLLLGISRFNQLLRVRPTKTRRELGNVLVVAPTRGGKVYWQPASS
jgi:hypothetical protein